MLSTLRLKWPLGQTLLLACLLLLPMIGLAEAIFRSESVRALLSVPELDNPVEQTAQPQDELRWERLEQLVEERGSINCVFLGSTRLSYTVKPDVFEEAYQAQTGQQITCFNYGGLLGPAAIVQEADLILDRYQPDFLIISTESLAIDEQVPDRAAARFESQNSTAPGPTAKWLSQHSVAYRYYATLATGPGRGVAARSLTSEEKRLAQAMSPDGYIPAGMTSNQPVEPPSPKLIDAYRRFRPPTVSPERMAKVMELQARGPILLLELPVHPTVMHFFEDGVETYRRVWLEPVEQAAARRGIPFWQSHTLKIIPEEGWASRSRLNPDGAEIFSRWLGEQVGRAAAGGRLPISSGPDRTEQP